jgi:hypothetical protein
MTIAVPITPFINVLVRVKRKDATDSYSVHCEPEAPLIVQPDTVINYQIVDSDPEIIFSGLEVNPPDLNQISAPSISYSGKLLTVNDANTYKGWLSLFLEFTNSETKLTFKHDPQVRNDPEVP